MTDRIVKPVRAWAEYDEWTWMADAATDKVYSIPTSGDGGPFVSQYISVVQAAAEGDMFRPLRSLRVLYENGYELKLVAWDNTADPENFRWEVTKPGALYEAAGGALHEDKDSEAVERAMTAAASWFSQVEWARLGTDSPEPEPAS
jgi:hypothetical protein